MLDSKLIAYISKHVTHFEFAQLEGEWATPCFGRAKARARLHTISGESYFSM